LSLGNVPGTFSVESKMRFFGSFPNSDSSSYMAAALRSGWSALAFTASYLDVWLTNAGNPAGAGDDATMVRAARFTPGRGGVAFPLLASSASYANDAAAQAGGVQIGDAYRNGSAVMIRVA
jgi:hypothetical protein